jgi:hypothetical protein
MNFLKHCLVAKPLRLKKPSKVQYTSDMERWGGIKPSGKNIDLTLKISCELFQKIRKHNQYSTAVIKITGRSFSTKESRLF